MPIHRQFTASCDACRTPFVGSHCHVKEGIAEFSVELKDAMRVNGWSVSNKYICPTCLDAIAIHGITIQQATNKEQS